MHYVERWPMVGRTEELAFLREMVADPDRAGVVIGGQPGVGKTRLVREALSFLPGIYVEWATATASAQGLPFGALAHLLPPGLDSVERIDLLAVIGRHLLSRADGQPLVFAIDDVHLLDASSAALVHHMTSLPSVTMVLTLRSGELAPDAVSHLLRGDVLPRLEVQPIAKPEFNELINMVLGELVAEASLDRLWRMTAGNILFTRELIADAMDAGSLTLVHGVWRWSGTIGHAPRLQEVIAERLQGLDSASRQLVELLSIAEPLSLEAIEDLVPDVATADLERRGLVSFETDTEPAHVRLGHPLIGELLRATLPESARREVTRALAAHLGQRQNLDPDDLLRLAMWKQTAGDVVEVETLTQAARRANQLGDHFLAERLVKAASGTGGLRATLELGWSLIGQNRFEDAAQVLVPLVPGRELSDQDRERLADGVSQAVGFGLGRIDDAEQAMAAVAEALIDPELRALVLCHRANLFAFHCRYAEAAELGSGALKLTSEDSVRVRALTSVGTSLVMSGRTGEALELVDGVLPIALALRERFPRAPSWAFTTRWNALALSGQVDQALGEIDGTIGLVDDPPAALLAQANSLRGRLHLAKGCALTASKLLLDAAATAREVRVREPSWCVALAGEAEALLGHLEQAKALGAEAVSLRRDEILAYEADERRALAWIDVQSGRLALGIGHLWEASDLAAARGQRSFDLMILNDLLRLGEGDAIERAKVTASDAEGALAAAVGHHADAASRRRPEDYDTAACSFEKIGFLLVAAELWSVASTRYREEGLRSRAKAAAKSSARLAGLCEGARTQPLQWVRSGPTTITRRQREIALLAAAGATNAQIATELTVSERTVESHLYAVFAKLDISDRAQLRAALERPAP